jgi:hypothetical protein
MLPLILAGGGAAMGAYQAQRQAEEAKKAEHMNNALAILDTAYSPFVQSQGYKMQRMDRGPGLIGGAWQGGMSGFQTGQGINRQDAEIDAMKQGKFNPWSYQK